MAVFRQLQRDAYLFAGRFRRPDEENTRSNSDRNSCRQQHLRNPAVMIEGFAYAMVSRRFMARFLMSL